AAFARGHLMAPRFCDKIGKIKSGEDLDLPRLCVRTRHASQIDPMNAPLTSAATAPALFAPRVPALLALTDGTVFRGRSIGAHGRAIGEVVFNTAMTGYE